MAWKPTTDELAIFMNRTFSDGQKNAAAMIVDGYAAQAKRHLKGKAFEAGQVIDELHILRYRQNKVFFDVKPVVSIDAVEIIGIDGLTIMILDPRWFTRRHWGMEGLRNSGGGETLRVTYTTGQLDDDDLDAIRAQILNASARTMGARIFADAHGATAIAVEGSTYQLGVDELVFTDGELRALPSRRPRGGRR